MQQTASCLPCVSAGHVGDGDGDQQQRDIAESMRNSELMAMKHRSAAECC
jgi:hypothetical protein